MHQLQHISIDAFFHRRDIGNGVHYQPKATTLTCVLVQVVALELIFEYHLPMQPSFPQLLTSVRQTVFNNTSRLMLARDHLPFPTYECKVTAFTMPHTLCSDYHTTSSVVLKSTISSVSLDTTHIVLNLLSFPGFDSMGL